MAIFLFVTLILTILILSALVSGSEAALLTLSYPKSKELLKKAKRLNKGINRALKLVYIKEHLQKYITTVVILNNIVNIVGSIYVGLIAIRIFEGNDLYIGIVSAVMTFLIIMFSEIIPKMYGEKYSADISLRIAKPLIFIGFVLTPVVYLLDRAANIFITTSNRRNISEGEIREMAILGAKEGSINTYENDLISKVFEMNDTEAYDIMIPRNKVITIQSNISFDEIAVLSSKTGFTRFPVVKDGEIIGLINAKDMFRYYAKKSEFTVFKILRPIIYAPETMKISTLESKFKKERSHMAIVINEHGDYVGIVTLEDVIEELLGEIEDEFDTKERPIKKITEKIFQIKGDSDIEYINNRFNLALSLDEDYTTTSGFIVSSLGKIPKVNDKIKFDNFNLRILKASKRKVILAELTLK